MTVHRSARVGFERSAGAYERARPDYPPDAVAWLAEHMGLFAGRVVLDLAAGTGKLTRALVPTGARVLAVEPLAGMRAVLEQLEPGVTALDGTAEAIPLPAASADAVTVAQAFHWFDGPAALAEIHRVLRPGGTLALVWNVRDLADPVQAAVEEILAPLRGTTPAHRYDRWRPVFDSTPLFGPSEQRSFANVPTLDAGGLVDRVASTSFVGELEDERRAAVLERVRALAATLPRRFAMPYTTDVEIFARRD